VACIDSQEYCSSNRGHCQLLAEDTDDAVFELTRRALLRSTVADAIRFRMGRELLAQDMVSQYVSAQLAPNQWEIEFEQLFKTSLARMQFNLLDIAVGDGKGRRGYDEVDKRNWGNGKLCGMYKYKLPRKPGGKNLNIIFFAALVTFFGLFILITAPYILVNNEPSRQPFLGEKVPIYLAIPGWLKAGNEFRASAVAATRQQISKWTSSTNGNGGAGNGGAGNGVADAVEGRETGDNAAVDEEASTEGAEQSPANDRNPWN
jgi:hypothetical protein